MKLKKPLGTKMTDGTTRYMAKEVAYMLGIKPSALSTYVHNKIIEGLEEHVEKHGRTTYYDRYAVAKICKERKVPLPKIVEYNSKKDYDQLMKALDYHELGLKDSDLNALADEFIKTDHEDTMQQLYLYMQERKILAEKIKKLTDENYFLRLKLDEQQELIKEYRIRFTRAMHSSEKVTNALISLLKKWGAEGLKPRKEIVDEYFRSGVPELFKAEAQLTSKSIDECLALIEATPDNDEPV